MVQKLNVNMLVFMLLMLQTFLLVAQSEDKNYKRGYGYGNHTKADMEALSVGTSWWYNWWHRPDASNSIIDVYTDFGMEFVPQAWNGSFNEAAMRAYLDNHPDVKYIMGFNEPNFRNQANMSPAVVAVQWHRIESIADDYNLKIVGPALNYSPDAPYQNPFSWMDAWLEACDAIGGCRFDFVNVHSYMSTVSALTWYLGEWKRYGKPIWLTEFCAWDGIETSATPQYQKNFMLEALPILDNDPDIYRYAWFVARSNGIPYNSLLAGSGVLTELGLIYTDQYEPTPSNHLTIRVIDETKGVVTNSEIWGEQSVYTWIGNTTTWAALNNMPTGTMAGRWIGMYNGLQGGRLEKTDEAWIWSYSFEPVNGLTYNWNPGVWVDSVRTENSLKAMHVNRNLRFSVSNNGVVSGELTLRLLNNQEAVVEQSAFTLNVPEANALSANIHIAPNPATDIVHLFSPYLIEAVRVYDIQGRMVLQAVTNGTFSVSELAAGTYMLQVLTSQGMANQKIIVN
jgi:hypothetical protein